MFLGIGLPCTADPPRDLKISDCLPVKTTPDTMTDSTALPSSSAPCPLNSSKESQKNDDSNSPTKAGEKDKKKRRPAQKTIRKKENYPIPTPLPQSIVDIIIENGGSVPKHVGTKELNDTDTATRQSRLNLIITDELFNDLNPQEIEKVVGENSKGLNVQIMDVSKRTYDMNMTKRCYSAAILFNHQWNKLVKDNGLKAKDFVELWGYRGSNGEYCMVLNVVRRRDDDDNDNAGDDGNNEAVGSLSYNNNDNHGEGSTAIACN